MTKYIGTVIVEAEDASGPMGAYGYDVTYADGKTAWVAPDDFEATYHKIYSGMTFGDALFLLKRGEKLRRNHWNLNSFLWLIPNNTLKSPDLKDDCIPKKLADVNGGVITILGTLCFYTYDTNGERVLMSGWAPSQYDLLAEDWEVVK